MSGLLDQLAAFIQDLVFALGYPGVTLIMLVENIFPPIPSELVMPFAGFVAGQGKMSFLGVWFAGTLGSVLGAVVLYYVGMVLGDTVVRHFLRRYGQWITVSESEYDRAMQFFEKYGAGIVFFGRLLPLVRSLISLPAGAQKMPLPKFLLYTALGSAIWSGLLGYAGLLLGENWRDVIHFIEQYQELTVIVVALVLISSMLWMISRGLRRRRDYADAE